MLRKSFVRVLRIESEISPLDMIKTNIVSYDDSGPQTKIY